MPVASSGVWWAEVEDVRARIERRRALEDAPRYQRDPPAASPSASSVSRQRIEHQTQGPGAGDWWAELEDVRARIEHRRALESAARQRRGLPPSGAPTRRTVTITGHSPLPGAEMPVRLAEREASAERAATASSAARLRAKQSPAEWLGTRPDRIAAWAVALGFLLVLAAILSAH